MIFSQLIIRFKIVFTDTRLNIDKEVRFSYRQSCSDTKTCQTPDPEVYISVMRYQSWRHEGYRVTSLGRNTKRQMDPRHAGRQQSTSPRVHASHNQIAYQRIYESYETEGMGPKLYRDAMCHRKYNNNPGLLGLPSPRPSKHRQACYRHTTPRLRQDTGIAKTV